jgi:hypothetical protein
MAIAANIKIKFGSRKRDGGTRDEAGAGGYNA